MATWPAALASACPHLSCFVLDDDDKFTPTKHLTPPPHHSSRPAAAHTETETPLLHQRKGSMSPPRGALVVLPRPVLLLV